MADTVLKTRVIESTCSHLLSSRQRLAADLVVSHISTVMPAQERLLRDLVACRACPRLTKAVTAVAGDQDPASLPYEQLLHLLQSLPITDYSGDLEASYRALLDAMRAGIDTELIQTLAAGLCDEVWHTPQELAKRGAAASCCISALTCFDTNTSLSQAPKCIAHHSPCQGHLPKGQQQL
jgi:hypothetical protein